MARISDARSQEKFDRTQQLIIHGAGDKQLYTNSIYEKKNYKGKEDRLSGQPMFRDRKDALNWITKVNNFWMENDKGWYERNSFTKELSMRALKEQQLRLNSVIKELIALKGYRDYINAERVLTEVIVQYDRVGCQPKAHEGQITMKVNGYLSNDMATDLDVAGSR